MTAKDTHFSPTQSKHNHVQTWQPALASILVYNKSKYGLFVPNPMFYHLTTGYSFDLGTSKFPVFPFLWLNANTESFENLELFIHDKVYTGPFYANSAIIFYLKSPRQILLTSRAKKTLKVSKHVFS